MATITLRTGTASGTKADAVVVGIAKGESGPALLPGAEDVDAATGGRLSTQLAALGATGKVDEVTRLPAPDGLRTDLLLAVGVGAAGEDGGPDVEALRRAAGAAARSLAGKGSAAVVLPADTVERVSAVAEGLALGAYGFTRYKDDKPPLAAATVLTPLAGGKTAKAAKAAVQRATVVAEAVHLVRDWVNTAPSDLSPRAFADSAREALGGLKLDVEVLDEKALRKGGYGGILGVGQGSVNPPRLVRIAYRPSRAKAHVAFVGKGITFDSGGLSIKPNEGMITMKCDMAGAATVLAATAAVARLGLPVAVTTYAAMAENMPSGTAQRPSDVLTMYGGTTVEVLNTDAEGRLVMADALVRATEDAPDLVVDVATLTGACMVALGSRTAGIMSNDDELLGTVHAIATDAGEQMWPLPLPTELREKLDSGVADLANVSGERYGGALTAGIFLKEFVGDGLRWAHLDIAGPAYNSGGPYGYTPKGGTGAGVRTLVRLVEEAAAGAV